jgi:hypothetical protein
LVDSITRESESAMNSTELAASAALLTGRIRSASRHLARISRLPLSVTISADLRDEIARLEAYTVIACCAVESQRLEGAIRTRLELELDSLSRERLLGPLLDQPLRLSASCQQWQSSERIVDARDYLVRAQLLAARGEWAGVRRVLRDVELDRSALSVGDIAVDYVLQEALLLIAADDRPAAARHLARWLAALPTSAAFTLKQWSQPAAVPVLLALIDELKPGGSTEAFGNYPARVGDFWLSADAPLSEWAQGAASWQGKCGLKPV